MYNYCPYCNHLKKAIKGENYCSNAGDNIQGVKSNAYYLRSKALNSGKHISRFSIRSVLSGYQYYKTGLADRMLTQDNYLITNQGQTWYSEIESEAEVEAIVVAFHPDMLGQAIYALYTDSEKLLDNPFTSYKEDFVFSENTFQNDSCIKQLFLNFKYNIHAENCDELVFQQLEFNLLSLVFQKHQNQLNQAQLLPSKKKAVKEELHKRLGLAKDYMLANLDKKIEVQQISKVAALSPYHFLRLFKALYKITPHQYLTQERMKLTQYLLQNSSKSIKEIAYETAYDNHSAFGRVFKSYFGVSPKMFRKKSY
jgi:AraC-like DNA-binding protein